MSTLEGLCIPKRARFCHRSPARWISLVMFEDLLTCKEKKLDNHSNRDLWVNLTSPVGSQRCNKMAPFILISSQLAVSLRGTGFLRRIGASISSFEWLGDFRVCIQARDWDGPMEGSTLVPLPMSSCTCFGHNANTVSAQGSQEVPCTCRWIPHVHAQSKCKHLIWFS